jgi:SulP family sulfate permease
MVDHVEESIAMMDHDDSTNNLSRSYEKPMSFGHRGNSLRHYYNPDKKWVCVSPMTRHVFGEPKSPVKMRRSRSRSFNDYIDSRTNEPNIPIGLSSLEDVIPPRRGSKPPVKSSPEDQGNPVWVCVMYGLINATIVLPVIMSFGNIIYQDIAFAPYAPVLIKLTMVSGVVHQICFSSLSTFKFAVGSVQDAGLIFLSSMAKDMVVYCRSHGHDDETMLATVTVGLSVATACLGVALILIGRLRLAGYVQMLPTCVVAGYLAYIGFFCGKSGIGLMAGASELTLTILAENILYILPGICGGLFVYFSVRTLRHVAVLPTCIIILLLCFYVGLAVKGSSVEQAAKNGWIRESEAPPVWYHTWDYLKLDKVVWSAMPQLLLTELSMIVVVALSSSLDVAAIELELKSPLNYNKELAMVGISNILSGLTGGYTGSYIFSQSVFSLRSGIRSRLAGFVLAFCEVLVIVAPFPILSYVPNFFYGSLLSMICIDLMYEWLWDFRNKVTVAEYILGLTTFGLIQVLGVEYGIIAGIAVYWVCRQLNFDVGELKMVANESGEDAQQQDQQETSQLLSNNSIQQANGPMYNT